MYLKKCFLLIALFLSIFGLNIASYAQGGNDPMPGIDIIVKQNCGPNEDQPCGFPVHLYRCEDGTVVTNSTDCGGQISMVKYMKLDGIDGETQDKIAAAGEAMWLCDNGDIVGRPQDCKDDTDDLPALLIEEKKYYELKEKYEDIVKNNGGFPCYDGTIVNDPDDCKDILPAKDQVEKIEGIDGEGLAGDDSDNATTKQGENNDPVPGIDVIIKRETIAAPSTLYRCEDGRVVEDSADCGPQIGMVKYMKLDKIKGESIETKASSGSGSSDGLDRIMETVNIANTVHICDDGTQVSLPSECDDTSEYDTIIYVPADDFYRIEGHQGHSSTYAKEDTKSRKGIEYFEDQDRLNGVNAPCTGPEDTSPGCDGVADATTKQGGDDPISGIDIIIKEDALCHPHCDKLIAGDSKLSHEELKAKKRNAQRALYKVTEVSVNTYKKKYNTKLLKALPKIPEEKFEEIYERIDTKLEKTKNNTTISETKKANLLSFIIAIKEMLEDSKNASN